MGAEWAGLFLWRYICECLRRIPRYDMRKGRKEGAPWCFAHDWRRWCGRVAFYLFMRLVYYSSYKAGYGWTDGWMGGVV